MKTGSMPCRRCHRLKPTDITRCCVSCNVELREMEKRKTHQYDGPKDQPPAVMRGALTFIEPNLD